MNGLARFVRYAAVGVLGASVHFGTTACLVHIAHVDPIVATIIGFLGALVVQYELNRVWVFDSRVHARAGAPRYVVVSVMGVVLNGAIMAVVTRLLGADYRIGLVLVVLLVTPMNYFLNRRWTFRPGDHGGASAPKRTFKSRQT